MTCIRPRPITIDGTEYPSLRAAALALGIPVGKLHRERDHHAHYLRRRARAFLDLIDPEWRLLPRGRQQVEIAGALDYLAAFRAAHPNAKQPGAIVGQRRKK